MRDYQKLQEQDRKDIATLAHRNKQPLHYCTGTTQCTDPMKCDMCYNAARLAVQIYRPLLEERVVQGIMRSYDVRCTLPHPGGD